MVHFLLYLSFKWAVIPVFFPVGTIRWDLTRKSDQPLYSEKGFWKSAKMIQKFNLEEKKNEMVCYGCILDRDTDILPISPCRISNPLNSAKWYDNRESPGHF